MHRKRALGTESIPFFNVFREDFCSYGPEAFIETRLAGICFEYRFKSLLTEVAASSGDVVALVSQVVLYAHEDFGSGMG